MATAIKLLLLASCLCYCTTVTRAAQVNYHPSFYGADELIRVRRLAPLTPEHRASAAPAAPAANRRQFPLQRNPNKRQVLPTLPSVNPNPRAPSATPPPIPQQVQQQVNQRQLPGISSLPPNQFRAPNQQRQQQQQQQQSFQQQPFQQQQQQQQQQPLAPAPVKRAPQALPQPQRFNPLSAPSESSAAPEAVQPQRDQRPLRQSAPAQPAQRPQKIESRPEQQEFDKGFPEGFTKGLPSFDFQDKMPEPDDKSEGFMDDALKGFPNLKAFGGFDALPDIKETDGFAAPSQAVPSFPSPKFPEPDQFQNEQQQKFPDTATFSKQQNPFPVLDSEGDAADDDDSAATPERFPQQNKRKTPPGSRPVRNRPSGFRPSA